MNGAQTPQVWPALGPRLVFFTGGTALRDLSRQLTRHTHNSVHLVTPFDSGGSSAALRRAFAMPAVGDIRNRLLALADSALAPAAVLDFCASRLPDAADGQTSAASLRQCLRDMGRAGHAGYVGHPDACLVIGIEFERIRFSAQVWSQRCAIHASRRAKTE